MDIKKNRKEIVLTRLKRAAAKIWDYRESETEGFDPIIDLLFGACASEFERLSTELYISQTRILEKIAQILLPEINLRPNPSYAVLQAKPVNIERQADQTDQFVFEKEFTGGPSGKTEQRKLFFSQNQKLICNIEQFLDHRPDGGGRRIRQDWPEVRQQASLKHLPRRQGGHRRRQARPRRPQHAERHDGDPRGHGRLLHLASCRRWASSLSSSGERQSAGGLCRMQL